MNNNIEEAVASVSNDFVGNMKENDGFNEYISKHLSFKLVERIMDALEREEEIIVRQSDLYVSESIPTQSVDYKRQIFWSPLVRCKDCRWALIIIMMGIVIVHIRYMAGAILVAVGIFIVLMQKGEAINEL